MPVFEEKNISEVTVEDLVGEGRKFKTTDDLAKAKAEADRVILARERELAELREALNKRDSVEDLIAKIQPRTPPEQRNTEGSTQNPPAPGPSLTEEDLAKKVRDVLQATTAEERRTNNLTQTVDKLVEILGTEDKASDFVSVKAKELGVDSAWLQDIAAQNPTAFFKVVGLDGQAPRGTPGTRPDVNTESFLDFNDSGPKPDTYAYWEAERREKGDAWYFSPDVQNKIMKAAFDNPEAFFPN